MLGSIAKGTTHVTGFLTGADCLSTISCFKKLGIDIEVDGTKCALFTEKDCMVLQLLPKRLMSETAEQLSVL